MCLFTLSGEMARLPFQTLGFFPRVLKLALSFVIMQGVLWAIRSLLPCLSPCMAWRCKEETDDSVHLLVI